MRILFFICLLAAGLEAPPALAEAGRIVGDAPLRHAPGSYDSEGRMLGSGTKVDIGVCFGEGAYCYVEAAEVAGYVEGRLLGVAAGHMDQLEKMRWDSLRQRSSRLNEAQMVAAWGDSLTAGAMIAADETYPAQAEALFGFSRDVENDGVGGQNSTAIAARMNAVPTLLSLAGNEIPSEGSILVTERTTTAVTNQGPRALAGTICDVAGRLAAETADGGKTYTYRFTRNRPGEAVACPADSVFRFAAGDARRERVAWIWAGTNGAAPEHSVADDIAAMVASLGHDHYLVGAIPSGAEHSDARIAAARVLNKSLAETYGERFVDLVGVLAAGTDGSAEDAADVAAGITPRSLRVDALHLNARGNAIIAEAWHDATLHLGF